LSSKKLGSNKFVSCFLFFVWKCFANLFTLCL
jgi:hypothetical protein